MSLSNCYEQLKQYDFSIGYCKAVIELELNDPQLTAEAHYKRAENYLRIKNYRKAHGDFYKVKLLDPGNEEALQKLLRIAKLLSDPRPHEK